MARIGHAAGHGEIGQKFLDAAAPGGRTRVRSHIAIGNEEVSGAGEAQCGAMADQRCRAGESPGRPAIFAQHGVHGLVDEGIFPQKRQDASIGQGGHGRLAQNEKGVVSHDGEGRKRPTPIRGHEGHFLGRGLPDGRVGNVAPMAVAGREPAVLVKQQQTVGQTDFRAGVGRHGERTAGGIQAIEGMGAVVDGEQSPVGPSGQPRAMPMGGMKDFGRRPGSALVTTAAAQEPGTLLGDVFVGFAVDGDKLAIAGQRDIREGKIAPGAAVDVAMAFGKLAYGWHERSLAAKHAVAGRSGLRRLLPDLRRFLESRCRTAGRQREALNMAESPTTR